MSWRPVAVTDQDAAENQASGTNSDSNENEEESDTELDILPFLVDQWSRKIFNLFKKVRKIIGENNLFYLSHDRKVI